MSLTALVVAGMMAMVGSASEPGVTGSGMETVRLMPDTMAMAVNLVATDEQFDKALAAIQQQADDVQKALRGLQTPPAEVTLEGPALGPALGGSQEAMVRRRMMQAMGRAPAEEPKEQKVTLSMVVSADWKLTAKDAVGLLKETNAIEQAVRAALPKPAEKGEEMTEEQEEEMMSLMGRMGEEEAPPGTPAFTFSAKLPPDKLQEARKQAYQLAVADATSLAEAAGADIGGLANISGYVSQEEQDSAYSYYYRTPAFASVLMRAARGTEPVAVAAEPREVAFSVRVEATFGLKTP
jgi:uncharacterized protein YggE